jgi:multicomponent K+:H+ antiporter subunit D
VALAGLPPLSGFLGKLMLLQGALQDSRAPLVFTVVLLAGLLVLVALARAGSRLFWNTDPAAAGGTPSALAAVAPVVLLLAGSVTLAVLASPVRGYAAAAAQQLLAPQSYIDQVLGARQVSREVRP